MAPSLLALLMSLPAAQSGPRADLILHSGRVHTLEDAQPMAQAVALRGGRIVFVGSDAEALSLSGSATRLFDLEGRAVYPGFEDAHGHLAGLALALLAVDLRGTASYEEVIRRVRSEAAQRPQGEWILGRGWDQNDWVSKALPDHAALSRAVPDHPVVLTRIDGHAILANAAALHRAGIDRRSPEPEGGRIHHRPDGELTGVFVDRAMALVRRVQPKPSRESLRLGLRRAITELHRHGVTAIHDAGVDTATIELYREMARAGEFDLRDYVMIAGDPETLDHWLPQGPRDDLLGDGRLSVRAVKLSADGALGSRGAALVENYRDDPGNRGLLTTPPAYVREVADRALAAGFQLCVHAIGDRANRLVLDAYEAALAARPTADHRFRVEHAQILDPREVPRFARLGVIPSMQAQHQTSDMPWAAERLGTARLAGAYAWRSLLDTGVIIPGGSDFPVEAPDPIAAFHAAVTRQDARSHPPGGWHPEQRMSRAEALAHITIWPARAAFAESRRGSLRSGKAADLVVLSGDLMEVAPEQITSLRVVLTVFGGRVVFRAPGGHR